MTRLLGASLMVVAVGACAASVSDHDNRIFSLPASVKLSASNLSEAYATDRSSADDRYLGRVLEVSGVVRGRGADGRTVTLAGTEAGPPIDATMHEDVAESLLATVIGGQRLTVKCFCEGLDQTVRLKSCTAPDGPR